MIISVFHTGSYRPIAHTGGGVGIMRRIVYRMYRYATRRSRQPNSSRWRAWRAWLWLQPATTFRREKV